ncbi:MAG: hypothetical protein WC683_01390 [bacterium]
MSRYRTVHCLLWNDDKFPFASDDCQLVFLHLLTTPLSSPFGLYKASLEALAAEKRWPFDRYIAAFREAEAQGFALYDEHAQVVLLPHFLRYNTPNSLNALKSWARAFDELPSSPLKGSFFHLLEALCEGLSPAFLKAFRKAFRMPSGCHARCLLDGIPDGIPDGIGTPSPIQEQEQEQEQEQIPPPRVARAIDLETEIEEGSSEGGEGDPGAVDRIRAVYVAALEARYGPAVAAEPAWAPRTRARVAALVGAHGEALVARTVGAAVGRWEAVAATTQGRLAPAPSIEALVGGFWRLFLAPGPGGAKRGRAAGRDAGEYRPPAEPLDVGWGPAGEGAHTCALEPGVLPVDKRASGGYTPG